MQFDAFKLLVFSQLKNKEIKQIFTFTKLEAEHFSHFCLKINYQNNCGLNCFSCIVI